ncbi:Mitoguardin 1 [Acropora cervicornis]|uniref:Mitoguardin 1 n=1 Tax=Acropora cervicornis TaxID=6130 RepID=A0AAD9QTL9_ACRCE|nr:Mitoguardin 1 [Acropora cervicornis]
MYRSSRVLQVSALLAFTFGAGTVLYLFARYFKRKRREPSTGKSSSYNDRPLKRRGTFYTSDERVSEDSAVDLAEDVIAEDSEVIEELIKTGVKNFEIALEHWYEAAECVMTHRGRNTLHDDDSILEAGERLNALIGSSRKLRRVIEQYGLSTTSLPRTPSNMLMWIDDESVQEQLQLLNLSKDLDNDAVSGSESFVSASDNAQLEFDDIAEETLVMESPRLKLFRETVLSTAGSHSHLEFYVSGLQHYICHGIPCRTMRWCFPQRKFASGLLTMVDKRFRLSLKVLGSKQNYIIIFSNAKLFLYLLTQDPSDFQAAFDECIQYTSSADNWEQIKEELTGRGVKDMSFYDVLLDFILLDAFDDLETPPYSVATAVQNRWLSARIKETDPYGFMAHLYVVAQYVSPLLAWGFMGTDEELKRVCEYFKVWCFKTTSKLSCSSLTSV